MVTDLPVGVDLVHELLKVVLEGGLGLQEVGHVVLKAGFALQQFRHRPARQQASLRASASTGGGWGMGGRRRCGSGN